MRDVNRQTCRNDRCTTITGGQVQGGRRGCFRSPSLGPGTQLRQHVCCSCQLSIYNNLRPGNSSTGDSSTWAPSQFSFPTDMRWGTPSPPTHWSFTGKGDERARGGGSSRGRLWTLLSSRHLHGELPSALEPQFLTQTGQTLLRGARGLAAQGKLGEKAG